MRNERGVTLVEALITAIIFGMVIATVFAVLSSTSSTTEKMTITGELEHRGRLFIEECRNEFMDARFTDSDITIAGTAYGFGIYSDGAEIRFRVVSGRDANGDLQYGYSLNGVSTQDLACFIRFEAETILRESAAALPNTVSPASAWNSPFPNLPTPETETLDTDINRDGDQLDTFVLGRIMRYIVAPDGHASLTGAANPLETSAITDRVFLKVDPNDGSRFDGNVDDEAAGAGEHADTEQDPIFRFVDQNWPLSSSTPITNANVAAAGKSLLFSVHHGNYDHLRDGFVYRRNSERIRFRNDQ